MVQKNSTHNYVVRLLGALQCLLSYRHRRMQLEGGVLRRNHPLGPLMSWCRVVLLNLRLRRWMLKRDHRTHLGVQRSCASSLANNRDSRVTPIAALQLRDGNVGRQFMHLLMRNFRRRL